MRLSIRRKRPVVVAVSAERLPEHLVWQRDQMRIHMADRDVRGFLDALLRQQGRSRRERSGWLAFLLDGAPNHPEPFDLMAELASSSTGTEAGPGDPPSREWPDDATDDGQGSGVPKRPPDSSGSAGVQAIPDGEPGTYDIPHR